jgi:hypothetical protein
VKKVTDKPGPGLINWCEQHLPEVPLGSRVSKNGLPKAIRDARPAVCVGSTCPTHPDFKGDEETTYERFGRLADGADEAVATRRAIYAMWRRRAAERTRTMGYLACGDTRVIPFAGARSRTIGRTLRDLGGAFPQPVP